MTVRSDANPDQLLPHSRSRWAACAVSAAVSPGTTVNFATNFKGYNGSANQTISLATSKLIALRVHNEDTSIVTQVEVDSVIVATLAAGSSTILDAFDTAQTVKLISASGTPTIRLTAWFSAITA